MNKKQIENLATKHLKISGAYKAPIDVHLVASKNGIDVQEVDIGEDISGIIILKDGKATIGYNPKDISERRRFTIAHELGHYFLHRDQMEMFVDKSFYALRDERSSKGEYIIEREANAFAASLLMPRDLVIEAVNQQNFDLGDDTALQKISEKFQVSTQAMSFRLANLNIF